MAKEKKAEMLFEQIRKAVVAFDEKATAKLCEQLLEAGIDAYEGITRGLSVGMEQVGRLYERSEYFIPARRQLRKACYKS